MVWVDGGSRVDLQTVVVLAGVFKQTVHGVQDLVGQQEEPLPAEPEDRQHLCRRGRSDGREERFHSSIHTHTLRNTCEAGSFRQQHPYQKMLCSEVRFT